MSLKIDITENLLEIDQMFDEFKTKQIVLAARRAMNRALVTARKRNLSLIPRELAIKKGELRKNHIRISKAKGGTIRSLEGDISFNTKGLPMLQFVRGKKQPSKQKGVKIRNRRKLKVMITPGNVRTMPKMFITKSTGGFRAFRRKAGTDELKRQHVPSVAFFFDTKGNIKRDTLNILRGRFEKVFTRELEIRLNTMRSKFK